MTRHLLRSIDKLFLPNNSQDRAIEEPISLNKLAKEDVRWRTTNTVLGWEIETMELVFALFQTIREKLPLDLKGMPKRAK